MADLPRQPTYVPTYRRPYPQVDPVPNLTAEPFSHVLPFVQAHLSIDVTWPRKWAQDFSLAGYTTRGIPAQPVTVIEFRVATYTPIFTRYRAQPELIPNNEVLLLSIGQAAPPFASQVFPDTYRRADRDFLQMEVLSYLPGPVTAPNIPVDFPTPMRARMTPFDFEFASTGIEAPEPFSQDDWQQYYRARALLQDFYLSGITTRGIPAPRNLFSVDLQIPLKAPRTPEDHIWAGFTTRGLPAGIQLPFSQYDFPLSYRVRNQYSDSFASPHVLLVTPQVAFFTLSDFPQVFRKVRYTQSDEITNWLLFANPGLPLTTGVVPNVVGLTAAQAILVLQAAGFFNIVQQTGYAVIHPPGQVFTQNPVGGTTYLLTAPVTIIVSLGPFIPSANTDLGYKVTTRNFSLEEMVSREWGSSFNAPDHRIYEWSNGRAFDSTDIGTTGIYKKGTNTQ